MVLNKGTSGARYSGLLLIPYRVYRTMSLQCFGGGIRGMVLHTASLRMAFRNSYIPPPQLCKEAARRFSPCSLDSNLVRLVDSGAGTARRFLARVLLPVGNPVKFICNKIKGGESN